MPTQFLPSWLSVDKCLSSTQSELIYAKRIEQLYAQARLGLVATLVNAAILTFLLWDMVAHRYVLAWLVCVFLISLLGGVLVHRYHHYPKEHIHPSVWHSWFVLRMAVSGLIWGALSLFLYPHDSIPHQILLALVIGGMVAGSTAVHAASKEAFLAYSIPAVIPVIVRFFTESSQFHVAMGMAGTLFLGLMIMTMRRNHEVLANAIRLQLENTSLIHHLSEERDRAEALNRALSEEVNACQAMEREVTQHRDHLEQLVEARTQALQTSEARFQFLAENVTDLIWMMELDGSRFLYMSASVEPMLGYSQDDAVKISLKDVLTPQSFAKAWSVMKEELDAERQGSANPSRFRTLELEHRRKDGSTIWAEIRARFYRDEQGLPIGFVGVTRDVTERKHLEKTKRRLDAQLLRSQKMEAIGTLAGGIAHDFNNLLTGVLGNISLAKAFFAEGSPGARFLGVAEHESVRAKDFTQQLLTFAKGGDPIKRVTALDVLVKNTVEFSLSGSSIAREYVYDEPLWLVEVDAGQISQVVQSVVTNAVEAMSKEGTLIIRWENHAMNESSVSGIMPDTRDGYVKISFTDNGSGIGSEDLPRIFDPYFTTKLDGHGLGLTSAYAITKKHNGHMTIESTLGSGTCVSLYFPACPEEATVESRLPLARKNGSGKVLVMDDEESIRVLASEMLRSCGYHFEMAKNGEEALALYQQAQGTNAPFSAVILDLTVPGGLGGKETLERLRQIDPNVKAVVSSGYSNDPIMAKYQKYGFRAVMTKPYSLIELSDVMYRLIMESSPQ